MKNSLSINYKKTFAAAIFITFALWLTCVSLFGKDSVFMYVFGDGGKSVFSDFYHSVGVSAQNNPYLSIVGEDYDHAYPPLAYAIYSLFSGFANVDGIYAFSDIESLSSITVLSYLIVCISITCLVLLVLFLVKFIRVKGLIKYALIIAILLSKPVIYALERGNIIILCLLLNMFFLYFHKSENRLIKELSLIALAISAGIKMSPAILGIILILDKQFKEALRTVVYGIIAFFVPFFLFAGGLSNIKLFIDNMGSHFSRYYYSSGSLFCCIQDMFVAFELKPYLGIIRVIAVIISLVIICGIPLYKNKWQQYLGLSIVLIILPAVAQFYCLVYLIPAEIEFFNANNNHGKRETLVLLSFCAISMVIPLSVYSAMGELIIIAYLVVTSGENILDYYYQKAVKQNKERI